MNSNRDLPPSPCPGQTDTAQQQPVWRAELRNKLLLEVLHFLNSPSDDSLPLTHPSGPPDVSLRPRELGETCPSRFLGARVRGAVDSEEIWATESVFGGWGPGACRMGACWLRELHPGREPTIGGEKHNSPCHQKDVVSSLGVVEKPGGQKLSRLRAPGHIRQRCPFLVWGWGMPCGPCLGFCSHWGSGFVL